tara:strand:- start:2012 stop:2212 length:201 start_codon:yes stop_codon:yes gene_type:complete
MMFNNCIHNITGDAPFNLKKFPMLIEVGDGMGVKKILCDAPSDIPQETDFIILEAPAKSWFTGDNL